MKLKIEFELKNLSDEELLDLIKEAVDILKERSEIPGKVAQIKPVKEKPEKKEYKRRHYKKNKAIKEKIKRILNLNQQGNPRKRRKQTRDFKELDKIVKEHYGKKPFKKIIAIAAEKGITTDTKQIDYRRRTLGLAKIQQRKGRPKKTDKKYLKSIEEASELDLKGIENQKNLNDIPGEDE